MSALSKYLPSAPPPPPVLLARGDAFFIRRVALAADVPAGEQVTLALEGMAPFPPEQLYHGHVAAADGQGALVFAAFRKRFPADETEAWATAALVTPDFLALLATRPAGNGATLHCGEGRNTALAWRAGDELPAVILARAGDAASAEALAREALERAGLPADEAVCRLDGEITLRPVGEDGLEAWVGEDRLGPLPAGTGTAADVRDPDFLVERRRAQVRDLWLWRGVLAAAALLVSSLAIDVGAGVLGWLTARREARVAAQAGPVAQIEEAQTLANRIGELSQKRLMPFEMLALINPSRPDSIVFQSIVTRGLNGLEISAQAANASDVGAYANALKTLAGLAEVRTGEVRSRDGMTTFVLSLDFKPEALRNGGGK